MRRLGKSYPVYTCIVCGCDYEADESSINGIHEDDVREAVEYWGNNTIEKGSHLFELYS